MCEHVLREKLQALDIFLPRAWAGKGHVASKTKQFYPNFEHHYERKLGKNIIPSIFTFMIFEKHCVIIFLLFMLDTIAIAIRLT
jgi:hypothetical protein